MTPKLPAISWLAKPKQRSNSVRPTQEIASMMPGRRARKNLCLRGILVLQSVRWNDSTSQRLQELLEHRLARSLSKLASSPVFDGPPRQWYRQTHARSIYGRAGICGSDALRDR